MKTRILTLVTLALLAVTTSAFAAGDPPANDRQALIEKNILSSLTSPMVEVRADAIQTVIDMKKAWPSMDLDYAVIPLMSVLKSDSRVELRILSALALRSFDSDRARFAVSQRALYDDSPRVARHCTNLMRDWSRLPGSPLVAQAF
jgi:hypothetical protein